MVSKANIFKSQRKMIQLLNKMEQIVLEADFLKKIKKTFMKNKKNKKFK